MVPGVLEIPDEPEDVLVPAGVLPRRRHDPGDRPRPLPPIRGVRDRGVGGAPIDGLRVLESHERAVLMLCESESYAEPAHELARALIPVDPKRLANESHRVQRIRTASGAPGE